MAAPARILAAAHGERGGCPVHGCRAADRLPAACEARRPADGPHQGEPRGGCHGRVPARGVALGAHRRSSGHRAGARGLRRCGELQAPPRPGFHSREVCLMDGQMSIVKLVLDASPVVQFVMILLLAASMSSWAIIFRKRMIIGRSRSEAAKFEESFWSGGDLGSLYRSIESRGGATGMTSIFEFGFREFARLRQAGVPGDQ